MTKKKKVLLKPKNTLGFNKELPICYNCLVWNPETGRCPWYSIWNKELNKEETAYFDYNHYCEEKRKWFTYKWGK